MIKKDHKPSFIKPLSKMRVVLSAVEVGSTTRQEIIDYSKLQPGEVRSALWNLCFIGAVVRSDDGCGRSVYATPTESRLTSGACFNQVRSVFDVPLPGRTIQKNKG